MIATSRRRLPVVARIKNGCTSASSSLVKRKYCRTAWCGSSRRHACSTNAGSLLVELRRLSLAKIDTIISLGTGGVGGEAGNGWEHCEARSLRSDSSPESRPEDMNPSEHRKIWRLSARGPIITPARGAAFCGTRRGASPARPRPGRQSRQRAGHARPDLPPGLRLRQSEPPDRGLHRLLSLEKGLILMGRHGQPRVL